MFVFQHIDWRKIEKREFRPYFRPPLLNELDTQNFADEFTSKEPVLSPPPVNFCADPQRQFFRGFSFVAPSILLSESVVGTEFAGFDEADLELKAYARQMSDSEFFSKYDLDLDENGFSNHGSCIFSIIR